jgi:hypothetical protein
VKESASKDTTDPELIHTFCKKKGINFTTKKEGSAGPMIEKIIKNTQKHLAMSSIAYLRKKAKKIAENDPIESNKLAQRMVTDYCKLDDQNRIAAPCFYSLNTFFAHLMRKKHPLLVKVFRYSNEGWKVNQKIDVVNLFYQPSADGKKFEYQKVVEPQENDPMVCVLEGMSVNDRHTSRNREEFAESLSSYDLKELMQAFGANHTQYPGKQNKNVEPPEDAVRQKFAAQADCLGCSQNNMSLFKAEHVYCDTYKNACKRVEST